MPEKHLYIIIVECVRKLHIRRNTQIGQTGDKMGKIRKGYSFFTKLTACILAAFIALTASAFISVFITSEASSAYAYETNTFRDFPPTPLGIENPQFSNSSGSMPATPTGWTETSYVNKVKGSTAMGVVDLSQYYTSQENINNVKLTEYPEYQSGTPRTPFGENRQVAATGFDNKILMVNTTRATTTVIGYESSSMTLAPNKFFQISAWVKTGDFYSAFGAAMRLNGIQNQNLAFSNIRTTQYSDPDYRVSAQNNFGWAQYTFYINTSSIRSETVTLALTVGDFYQGKTVDGEEVIVDRNASGYAFFANVEAYEISPTAFNLKRQSEGEHRNVRFVDLSLDAADPQTDLSFARAENYFAMSAEGAVPQTSHLVSPASLNTDLSFALENNRFNLDQAPVSPRGKNSGDGHILVVSSYDQKSGRGPNAKYHTTAVGFESGQMVIEQFNYYRLSVWVNTHNISGGAGATLVVTTNAEDLADHTENMKFTATGCNGDLDSLASYGWREYAFYIKGSIFNDYEINLGLWLGQEDNLSSGTAMFSYVRFEQLTAEQYLTNSGNSAGGSPVDIDGHFTDTGVTNGNFNNYNEPEDFSSSLKRPLLTPSGWNFFTPSSAATPGLSRDESLIDTDLIISGIMPTHPSHFSANSADYGAGVRNPHSNEAERGFVLYLASSERNAFGYESSPIALEENASYALTVRLRADNITGYGANLVLKDDNGILATLENITNTNRAFRDFTFYIQNDSASRSVTLEIWLGLAERGERNHTKLSSGNVYVDTVAVNPYEEEEGFNALQTRFQNDLNLNVQRDYAVVLYSGVNFIEFDAYDNNYVKYPYLWSVSGPSNATPVGVRSGIFDSANVPGGNGEVPARFENPDRRDEDGRLKNNNVLMLTNSTKTASRLTFDRPFNLEAETYYRLEVSIMVDIRVDKTLDPFDERNRNVNTTRSIGGGIELTGTDFKFENILETTDPLHRLHPDEVAVGASPFKTIFETYTFYIFAGHSNRTFHLAFTLGGENFSEFCAGFLYVNSVNFTDITNTLFEEEADNLPRGTRTSMRAAYNEPGETLEEEDPDAEEPVSDVTERAPNDIGNWGLIPSILFGAAFLLAIFAWVARRVSTNLKARKAKRAVNAGRTAGTPASEYDREETVKKGFKDFSDPTSAVSEAVSDSEEQRAYEEFDDVVKTDAPAPDVVRKGRVQPATPKAEETVSEEVKSESEDTVAEGFEDSFED